MNRFSVSIYLVLILLASSGLSELRADKNLESLPDSLKACVDEEDDALRLACYDREVPRWGAIPTSEISQQQKEEGFGQPPLEAHDKDELTEITVKVTKIHKGGDKVTVWLDNDQVWQQKYAKPFLIKVGDEVIIEKKSMIGGHRLKARGRHIEVKRVK